MGAAAPSTLAMLVQMVFEKFAKAALLRQQAVTTDWARRSHGSASRLLLVLRRQRGLFEPLGGPQVWGDVLSVVDALERAHPQLASPQGPQLEYPWENVRGEIQWPARDLGIAVALGDPRRNLLTRVLRFAGILG